MSSLSRVVVTQLKNLRKHENADSLLVGDFDGLPFLVNMNDSNNGDWRAIVPIDMEVPDSEMWPEFVRGQRIRAKRLRGVFSMAVALPVPVEDHLEGKDITEKYNFTKWEPAEIEERDGIELQSTGSGRECSAPSGLVVYKYDLESLRKYHKYIEDGESVYITAKLHGENFTTVYWNDKFHVKSRNRWIAEGDNKWWKAFSKYDFSFLKDYPGLCLVGEKYGNVNKFRYDCVNGEEKIRIFDIYDATKMSFYGVAEFLDFCYRYNIDKVPELYYGPWRGMDYYKDMVEGNAVLGGNIEEGYVAETVTPKYINRIGRAKWKYHSEKFLIFQGKSV